MKFEQIFCLCLCWCRRRRHRRCLKAVNKLHQKMCLWLLQQSYKQQFLSLKHVKFGTFKLKTVFRHQVGFELVLSLEKSDLLTTIFKFK